jgi:MFS family permease
MGIREGLGAVALLLGPAAAGTLMVLFDGSTVLWITAATSLAAALVTLLIPYRVGAVVVVSGDEPAGGSWTQLRDGWRVLLRSPFLVATTMLTVATTTVLASLQGLVLPVYFTQVDRPGMLGFVLTALAAGMLVGAGCYAAAGARGRRRPWFVAGLVGTTVGFGVIATLSSVWVVFAGAFVMGVLMIERIPEGMRGRIMGTQNAVMTAAPPVGLMTAALLTEYLGVEVAAYALAGIGLVAGVLGLLARSLRHLEPETEPMGETQPAVRGA